NLSPTLCDSPPPLRLNLIIRVNSRKSPPQNSCVKICLRLNAPMRYRPLVVLGLFIANAAVAAIHEPVKLDSGRVAGVAGSNAEVRVFKGIPYAAPPVGKL